MFRLLRDTNLPLIMLVLVSYLCVGVRCQIGMQPGFGNEAFGNPNFGQQGAGGWGAQEQQWGGGHPSQQQQV